MELTINNKESFFDQLFRQVINSGTPGQDLKDLNNISIDYDFIPDPEQAEEIESLLNQIFCSTTIGANGREYRISPLASIINLLRNRGTL